MITDAQKQAMRVALDGYIDPNIERVLRNVRPEAREPARLIIFSQFGDARRTELIAKMAAAADIAGGGT